jgi:hypothetical protein
MLRLRLHPNDAALCGSGSTPMMLLFAALILHKKNLHF